MNTKNESPADRLKREQAEKAAAAKDAEKATEDKSAAKATATNPAEVVQEQRAKKEAEEAEQEAKKTDAQRAASTDPTAKQAVDTAIRDNEIAERNQDFQEAIGGEKENAAMAHSIVDNTTSKPVDADSPEARATLESQLRVDAAAREARRPIGAKGNPEADLVDAEVEALEAERKERFRRAEEFEKRRAEEMEARRNAVAEAASARRAPQSMVRESAGKVGFDKLNQIAQALPRTTPNEHVLFGLGGVRFTAGDLRDAVGMPRT